MIDALGRHFELNLDEWKPIENIKNYPETDVDEMIETTSLCDNGKAVYL